NTDLREWKRQPGRRRVAAVSSFGVGGTNAHVVVEEAPEPKATRASRPYQLLMLSAKTESAREASTDRLAGHLEPQPDLDLADVSYTLQVGRKAFPFRRFLISPNGESREVAQALRARQPENVRSGSSESRERPIIFLFSGQGAQYPGMGRDLWKSEPI